MCVPSFAHRGLTLFLVCYTLPSIKDVSVVAQGHWWPCNSYKDVHWVWGHRDHFALCPRLRFIHRRKRLSDNMFTYLFNAFLQELFNLRIYIFRYMCYRFSTFYRCLIYVLYFHMFMFLYISGVYNLYFDFSQGLSVSRHCKTRWLQRRTVRPDGIPGPAAILVEIVAEILTMVTKQSLYGFW